MTNRIASLADEIVRLQTELDREIFKRRKDLGWRLHAGLVEFEHGVTLEHRRLRVSAGALLVRAPVATVLSAPVIYSLILPLALLDLSIGV